MKLAVLPGDGIGPEVIDAALPVIDALGLPWELEFGDVGWKCWETEGAPVPARTWQLLADTDTCLLGAITSKPAREAAAALPDQLRASAEPYLSPVIQLRQNLALFANVRPVHDYRADTFDFTVIRENTEGLYAGFDYRPAPAALQELIGHHPNIDRSVPDDTTVTIRLQTRSGVERIVRFAFEYARRHHKQLVTIADKPNVLRSSSTLLREVSESVASDFPGIESEILNVDALALWMVTRPARFGVIVAENMFGDILSDLGAGVMGGLGLAPSANIGRHGSYFEPVHGSAPNMTAGRANPTATFLTIAEIADHHGHPTAATAVRSAVTALVKSADPAELTYDLGGAASTAEAAAAIIRRIA